MDTQNCIVAQDFYNNMNSLRTQSAQNPANLGSNIRSLNWFLDTFSKFHKSMEPQIGHSFSLDQEKLRLLYFDWIELFESESVRQYSEEDYWDCVDYVAGMGLTGLIDRNPLIKTDKQFVPTRASNKELAERFGLKLEYTDEISEIIDFWPEGFIYVCFCVWFINSLKRHKTGTAKQLNDQSFRKSFWWTFRENAMQDTDTVMYFFDNILDNNFSSSTSNSLASRIDAKYSMIKFEGRSNPSLTMPTSTAKNVDGIK